jgi:putative membrane protein
VWSTGDPRLDMVRGFEAYALVQLVIFLGLATLLWWTRLGAWLTPTPIKRDRVHAQALAQFRARGLERTRDRTGVLIFACMTDHVAEVVADAAIYERVEPEFWGSTIMALLGGIRAGRTADGLVAAVTHAGGALAEHFPPRPDDRDELPNHLIEL